MTSHGDSPTPEEDNCVSILSQPQRLGTPLARTTCSAALGHDLEVVHNAFPEISDVRRLMRIRPIPRQRHWHQLLQGSFYRMSDVENGLSDEDMKRMSYVTRGPTVDGPALSEELTEFARLYESQGCQRGTSSPRRLSNYHRRSSPVAYDVDNQVEVNTQPIFQSPTVSRTDHRSP
jgi:hypothetical protein